MANNKRKLYTYYHVNNIGHGQDEHVNALTPSRRQTFVATDRDTVRTGSSNRGYIRNASATHLYPNMRNYLVPLNAMTRLQEDRTSEVTPRSLVTALLWELCQLKHNSIASVVNVNGTRWFDRSYDPTAEIVALAQDDYPFSNGMRDAEYVFWPYQFRQGTNVRGSRGRWVTIVMRIEGVEFELGNWDRVATDIAIIDPDPDANNRTERRREIQNRLPSILARDFIRCDHDCWDATISIPYLDQGTMWATGHVNYAVCRELFRRVRKILHSGTRGTDQRDFWLPFEEDYNFDYYRKLMVGACSHRTVEKSKYYGRIAIEMPNHIEGTKQAIYEAARMKPPDPAPDVRPGDRCQTKENKRAYDYDEDQLWGCQWQVALRCVDLDCQKETRGTIIDDPDASKD